MPCTPTRTRAAVSEPRTKAATARSEKRRRRLGAIHVPSRRMRETFPRTSSSARGESGADIASPRVTRCESPGLACLETTRCAKRRRSRPKRTMSPLETALLSALSTTRVSPGQTEGSMLQPMTFSRSVPDERNTSHANSHLRAWVSSNGAADELMRISY